MIWCSLLLLNKHDFIFTNYVKQIYLYVLEAFLYTVDLSSFLARVQLGLPSFLLLDLTHDKIFLFTPLTFLLFLLIFMPILLSTLNFFVSTVCHSLSFGRYRPHTLLTNNDIKLHIPYFPFYSRLSYSGIYNYLPFGLNVD